MIDGGEEDVYGTVVGIVLNAGIVDVFSGQAVNAAGPWRRLCTCRAGSRSAQAASRAHSLDDRSRHVEARRKFGLDHQFHCSQFMRYIVASLVIPALLTSTSIGPSCVSIFLTLSAQALKWRHQTCRPAGKP
jgi:hypothetical protein